MQSNRRRSTDRYRHSAWQLTRFAGAAALIATGAIHLDLYLTGYRTLPTIGWLFLLQIVSAFVLAVATLVTPRRVVSLTGAVLLFSTLVGNSKIYLKDEVARQRFLDEHPNHNKEFQRLKGLGEMDWDELRDTTMDAGKRTLLLREGGSGGSRLPLFPP